MRKRPLFAAGLLLLVGGVAIYLIGRKSEDHEAGEPVPPKVRFEDVTTAAGIRFRHANGAAGKKLLPETMGAGVAVLDFDRDGKPDLFFVNSRSWPGHPDPPGARPTCVLYRNKGDGTFE